MTENGTIMRRVLMSYKLMLDFYGMRLEDEASGLVSRSENYASRYRNLCSTYFCPNLVPAVQTSHLAGSPWLVVHSTRASVESEYYIIRPSTSYAG